MRVEKAARVSGVGVERVGGSGETARVLDRAFERTWFSAGDRLDEPFVVDDGDFAGGETGSEIITTGEALFLEPCRLESRRRMFLPIDSLGSGRVEALDDRELGPEPEPEPEPEPDFLRDGIDEGGDEDIDLP